VLGPAKHRAALPSYRVLPTHAAQPVIVAQRGGSFPQPAAREQGGAHENALELPLKWKKPQTIFVNSMSDLFHKDVPVEFIAGTFGVMRRADWHKFQVLTKRSDRLLELSPMLLWAPHMWMSISAENLKYTSRIEDLRRTGAMIKFLSLEPLLGPLPGLNLEGIDWVIVGGESGPGARFGCGTGSGLRRTTPWRGHAFQCPRPFVLVRGTGQGTRGESGSWRDRSPKRCAHLNSKIGNQPAKLENRSSKLEDALPRDPPPVLATWDFGLFLLSRTPNPGPRTPSLSTRRQWPRAAAGAASRHRVPAGRRPGRQAASTCAPCRRGR
jgi:hypothetical protein